MSNRSMHTYRVYSDQDGTHHEMVEERGASTHTTRVTYHHNLFSSISVTSTSRHHGTDTEGSSTRSIDFKEAVRITDWGRREAERTDERLGLATPGAHG